jgi:hypothetical protein
MTNEYEVKQNDGVTDGFLGLTPHNFDVFDKESGDKVGQVAGRDAEDAGRQIADGNIRPS